MTPNDFKRTITQAIDEIKKEQGDSLDLSKINLVELERRTGASKAKLRRIKRNGFVFKFHGNTGHRAGATVFSGFERYIDELLAHSVSYAPFSIIYSQAFREEPNKLYRRNMIMLIF